MHLKTSIAKRLGYEKRESPYKHRHPCRAIETLVGGPKVILDIGANWGQTAIAYRRYFPEAKIYSFEPFEATFEQLKGNVEHAYQLAMGKDVGVKKFFHYENPATNSLIPLEGVKQQYVEVEASTVDLFAQEHGIEAIDVLKSDTQGTDLDVLMGAKEMLGAGKVRVVLVEALITPLYEGQCYLHEIMSYMAQMGYTLFDLFECAINEKGAIEFADAMFYQL